MTRALLVYGFSKLFTRGYATLHLAMSVSMSIGLSNVHISELRAVFALVPNRPLLSWRVSGLVYEESEKNKAN